MVLPTAQMRSSGRDARHTDTKTTNDNLMDKLIYTDQSTCAIDRGTVSNQQTLPSASDHNASLGTLHLCALQVTKTTNCKLTGCLALPLGTWSINLFASDSNRQKHCILISCHIESSPVCCMFAASHCHCQSMDRITLTGCLPLSRSPFTASFVCFAVVCSVQMEISLRDSGM